MSYKERVKRKKLQNESYSLWMDMLYRLSLANHVSDACRRQVTLSSPSSVICGITRVCSSYYGRV